MVCIIFLMLWFIFIIDGDKKVFFSEGYSVPWDGKRNGVDLPINTYYVIELKDSGKVFNGTVNKKMMKKLIYTLSILLTPLFVNALSIPIILSIYVK